MTLADVHALRNAIGSKTTLDTTPPSFTLLQIEDPTASNDRIEISFALNEPGTAYCRATLSDSGKIATDMPLVSKPVSLFEELLYYLGNKTAEIMLFVGNLVALLLDTCLLKDIFRGMSLPSCQPDA